jgi:hypothetical protein
LGCNPYSKCDFGDKRCYFYVTDGWTVYPGFIPEGDQIVSKTANRAGGYLQLALVAAALIRSELSLKTQGLGTIWLACIVKLFVIPSPKKC